MTFKQIDRCFILTGLLFAGAGLLLGEHMGRTGDHGQMPTHAHIMLVGWVFACLYGVLYRLWPALKPGWLPIAHFVLHTLGGLFLTIALFHLFGGMGDRPYVIPLVAAGALAVILGWFLFLVLFFLRAKD